jgi:hypothetical protein
VEHADAVLDEDAVVSQGEPPFAADAIARREAVTVILGGVIVRTRET